MNRERGIVIGWRAILWGGSGLLLAWLFYQNLVPTGVLVLQNKKGSPASLISDLHPEQRVIEINEGDPPHRRASNNQTFYVDPVYFDAKVPREFDTVTVTLAWQNQAQPILELGARRLRGSWGFVMKPLQNKVIDAAIASSEWKCQRYDGVMFCQRVKNYTDFSSLLSRPPQEKVLAYNYALPENVQADVMNVNTDVSQYNYLVAAYTPPESFGDGWYRQSVTYDWEDFALYINEISFLISAPELNKGHGQIVLGDISILLKRDPLNWDGFMEYVKNQLKRLKT